MCQTLVHGRALIVSYVSCLMCLLMTAHGGLSLSFPPSGRLHSTSHIVAGLDRAHTFGNAEPQGDVESMDAQAEKAAFADGRTSDPVPVFESTATSSVVPLPAAEQ